MEVERQGNIPGKPLGLARSRSRYKGNRSQARPISNQLEQHAHEGNPCQVHNAVEQTISETFKLKPNVSAAVARHAPVQQATSEVEHAKAKARPKVAVSQYEAAMRHGPSTATPIDQPRKIERSTKDTSLSFKGASRLPHRANEHDVIIRGQNLQRLKQGLESPKASPSKPAFDAPISAVNAGERRVTVQYGQSVFSLPVMPSTTSLDLVREAAMKIGDSFDTENTIFLESFRQLGLERPLRPYEYIRSVLNSWDFDSQNALVLTEGPNFGTKGNLVAHVAKAWHITDLSSSIYHSQRPRHWEKHVLTLRSDGQLLIEKKGTSTNLCHLSDFDIYVPTHKQLTKSIKPPKKFCFAVKSQQKSSMFLSSENFVHFFCTKDKKLADAWRSSLQSWRGWYLDTVMGQGLKTAVETVPRTGTMDKLRSNPDETAMSTGSIQVKDGSIDDRHTGDTGFTDLRRPSLGVNDPCAAYSRLSQHSDNVGTRQPFLSSGLLGRTYTKRKQAQERQIESSFGGRSRKGAINAVHPLGTERSQEPGNLAPLVDLTPQYQEPPQHRRGKGVTPEIMPTGGLVEVATSPDVQIPIPPLSSWKRDETAPHGLQRLGTVRNGDLRKAHEDKKRGEDVYQSSQAAPFRSSVRDHRKGTQTGDRNAQTPLIDVRQGSRYAPGSLLASVEKYYAGNKPAIARDKTVEVTVTVGES